jgi:hypothetical protein
MRSTTVLVIAISALLAACSGGPAAPVTQAPGQTASPGQPTASPGQPTASPGQPTSPPIVGGGSVIHVVVASGPLAGTYDRTGIKYDCNTSATGSGATFLDMATTEGVSSLTFSSGVGGASVTSFYFNVIFGAPATSTDVLEIQTLVADSAQGSGTATLQDNGSTIKWTIDGTTEDGIGIQATVECGPVDRR